MLPEDGIQLFLLRRERCLGDRSPQLLAAIAVKWFNVSAKVRQVGLERMDFNHTLKHMKQILIAIACLALVGCEEGPKTDKLEVTPKVAPSTNQVEKVERFVVRSQGTFNAGYDNAAREIFILKDNQTGEEYLGITDCTVIRIKKKKDESAEAAMDTAADMLEIAVDAMGE